MCPFVLTIWLALVGASEEAALQAAAAEAARRQAAFMEAHGDLPIGAVRMVGLRRTKEVVIRQWIRVHPGEPLSQFRAAETWEDIFRLGIFSALVFDFERTGDQVDIVIRPTERWTLYPVPLFWYFEQTRLGGLVLAESNAFGYNKGWAIGGVYSNRGWYTLAAYVDPNIAFTEFYGTANVWIGSGMLENAFPDARVYQSIDITRVDFQYQVGRTFRRVFSTALTGALRWGQVEGIRLPGDHPPVDGTILSQGIKLIYGRLKNRFYYEKGLRLTAEYQHGFSLSSSEVSFDSFATESTFTTEGFRDHAVTVGVNTAWARIPTIFEYRLGGLEATRTLPVGLVGADSFVSSYALYQWPVISAGWGTIALLALGELGTYVQDSRAAVLYGGPGGGIRFYLRNVTVPAVGGDVAYEANTGTTSFSFAIGYRPPR